MGNDHSFNLVPKSPFRSKLPLCRFEELLLCYSSKCRNVEAGYMRFFMLHHRIFGETLNLDHSLSLTAQTKQSKSVKMLSSTLNFYLLVPYHGGVVSTRALPGEIANAKCK